MSQENNINDILEVLEEILKQKEEIEPDKELIEQYVALLVKITKEGPTKETANLGVKLMHTIYMFTLEKNPPSWIYDLEEKTYSYFYF